MTACFAEQVTSSVTMETGPSSWRILVGPSAQVVAEEAEIRSFSLVWVKSARAGDTHAARIGMANRIQPRPVLVQCTDRLLPDAANRSAQAVGGIIERGRGSSKLRLQNASAGAEFGEMRKRVASKVAS